MRALVLGTSLADAVMAAKRERRPLDVEASSRELFTRYRACGYSRREIALALEAEASAAGIEARAPAG